MIGVVLAGGRGRRMGGHGKPGAALAGRALIEYPVAALGEVCQEVAVVCKPSTALPPLPAGVARWDEPEAPRHPAAGIAHALARAGGPVLVCAADMPFVTAEACRSLVQAFEGSRDVAAALAVAGGRLQPAFGVYAPAASAALSEPDDAPLTRLAEALSPALVQLAEPLVRSVNTPEELAAAERELGGRR